MEVLRQELELKINENEQVHVTMFEKKKEFHNQIDLYKYEINELEKARQNKEIEYQNLVKSQKQIENEMGVVKEEKLQLKIQYGLKIFMIL